ncbi:MAG: VOC family protein [Candidatus Dormibacteraeota bacterium]|uniref:VOC family protein n=1 Tax=Candidatus Amunia macphersoniae TaxID=3127014 RepID=A0A934NEU0_9BACT|nr:VOC family protein [Candidatus Dormibacteraeota bacterium]
MGNPVMHFEVVGRDAPALQAFYGDAFGWTLAPAMPAYAMAYPGVEGGINGGIGAAMDGGPGHVTIYVDVVDLEATLETIERLGGRRVAGPIDVPNGPTLALFADPEGHVVGLTEAGSGQARAQR